MDLKQIFSIFKRWIWLLILGALIAGGFGYYTSNQQTPMYRASARFVVLRAASTSSYDYYAYIDYQQLISTYTQLLSTNALLEQVSEEVGFPVYGGANAEQIGETQFVRLTVTNENPQKAAIIANTLIDVLIDQNEQLQSVRYNATEQNLQQRADQALRQMEALENQIDQITEETVQEQLSLVETQLEELQAQVNDLETKIARINPNPAFAAEEAIFQRQMYQTELDQIKPVLSLYQELYTQLVVMGEPIQQGGNSNQQVAQIQRTFDLYQQIYLNSISSLEALNMTRVQSAPNVVQVEPASVPTTPISPRPMQDAGLYAAVGAFAMAGLAFLVEFLDDTLKTPDDVKNTLGLPVLGFVADIKNSRKGDDKNSLFVANQPRSPVTEAFRSLRTNLDFAGIDDPLKTLLITSAAAEEGKTTISSNLAVVMAYSGKRVLLLDADMRRPSVHNQFNISNRVGLSDLIRKRLSIPEVLQVSEDIPNLSVITSGSLPHNPSELSASKRMENLLNELKTQFEIVIIDTPPLMVTDAHVLSAKVDGVVIVVQPGKTRARAVQAPLEELSRVGANLVGVVMNRIPRNREYYYGGFKYYSPYGSENGYHSRENIHEFIEPTDNLLTNT